MKVLRLLLSLAILISLPTPSMAVLHIQASPVKKEMAPSEQFLVTAPPAPSPETSLQKKKKGLFSWPQRLILKRFKKRLGKHFKRHDVHETEQSMQDAFLIGILTGALLGLTGILILLIAFKKGPRKRAALRGGWIGVLAILAVLLISIALIAGLS